MRILFLPTFLYLCTSCGHLSSEKEPEQPLVISFNEGASFKLQNVRELSAKYPHDIDLTQATLEFFDEAKKSKAKFLSHLTITQIKNEEKCVIYLGTKEDLLSLSYKEAPQSAVKKINTHLLSEQFAKSMLYESKPFCERKKKKRAVLNQLTIIQSRIYVPTEGSNENTALD